MGSSLEGSVAVVTGVSRAAGIGQAIARELASAGCKLFLSYYRPYDRQQPWGVEDHEVELLLRDLSSEGAEVEALEVDLATPSAAEILFSAAVERFGAVNVLVNNAAHSVAGDLRAVTAEDLDRHYAVNLRATLLLCREFVRRHRPGTVGRIINMTSGQGVGPMPGEVAYAATKGAVDALTVTLSAELAPHGIRINAVDPGPTDTGWMTAAERCAMEATAPFGRMGMPRDAARLVRFLASDAAGWITGQVLRARGGL